MNQANRNSFAGEMRPPKRFEPSRDGKPTQTGRQPAEVRRYFDVPELSARLDLVTLELRAGRCSVCSDPVAPAKQPC